MVSYNIKGKRLNVIRNMYRNIKSCVQVNRNNSTFFTSNIGVRQGENLSPFLFNTFLNDLYDFFRRKNVNGVCCTSHESDDEIWVLAKLFILLYADDTVILSESADDLQLRLKAYEEYCALWKLEVNIAKTKVLIFSKSKILNYEFKYEDEVLETLTEFKYLGILFSKNNSFIKTKQHIADQGKKAVYSLLKKVRYMQLPVDMQVELFNKLVKPILLYVCEIWGVGNVDVIERV